ncbi:MAG: NUDIX hydrolase [Gammaproteobacteria bacterium]|nr:NUDIX hydrolase [Gammaproteobacteria bacterium]MDP6653718.1 NUDIX hydrolase [Gammaproteobacteria bacterium]|tara:strand:- start:497 stop:1090 length:594 start_codon:yes stop_codon:yes gene_type:complete
MTDIEPVPAATVVLVREPQPQTDIEILLLRRNSSLVFHGGHWVFPGGRIDTSDFEPGNGDLEYPAALNAAVRETKEEAGIDIDAGQLIHTAHWTTPPRLPRRFSTWFFICPLFQEVSVKVDNDEILEHRWISPSAALAESEAEALVLPRPTRTTLQDIASHRSLQALIAAVTERNIRVFPADSEHYKPQEMGYLHGR